MGLSERKSKQKIAADPRNLGWSQDTNRFSFQHLQKFGWDPSQGLGADNNKGNAAHIKVIRKLDSSGIGTARALKEGAEVGGAGEGLNSLFARLKKAGESQEATPEPASEREETPVVIEAVTEVVGGVPVVAPTPRPLINSSRHKYVRSKRLAASSPAAMAEILGIPVSSLPTSPSPLSGSATPIPIPIAGPSTLRSSTSTLNPQPSDVKEESRSRSSTSDAEDVLDHTVFTTAPISVSEYFRRKMAQKKAEREGKPVPTFEGEPERYNDVAKGFEGKKIKFAADEDEDEDEAEDIKVKVEEEMEIGEEGAGLGSKGDPNKVKSEPVSEAEEGEQVKFKKEKKSKKDKKDKSEKKDKKEKKKDKGKAVVDAVGQSVVAAPAVEEGEKKSKKEKKEKKRKREDEGAVESAPAEASGEKVKKRKRDGDAEVEGEKKSKKNSRK